MKHRAFISCFTVMVIFFLAGADNCTITSLTSPMAGQLKGVGTYKVDPNNNFRQLVFKAQNTKTKQTATLAANAAGGNWDATQTLAAANYNGWATLVTQNAQLMLIYTDSDAPVLNCDVN